MRIGMILDNEYLIDARVPNEAKYLTQHGHEVYVLCLNFDHRPYFETVEGVHIVRFDMSHKKKNRLFGIVNTIPVYDWIWIKEIKRFLKRFPVDALHAHDLYMAKATFEASKTLYLPITLDLHENYPAAIKGYTWANTFPRNLLARPNRWKQKELRYLSYADNIVVLSEPFRQTLCEEYPALNVKKFTIYPNVPDVDWFLSLPVDQSIANQQQNHFTLLYFGVIGARRGMVICFEALRHLIPVIPEINFMVIGPVDSADRAVFQQYLNDAELKNHIIYYPWIDIKKLPSYLLASDVCVSAAVNNPQHDSGLGNKIFQYMLGGRAAVLTNSKPVLTLAAETGCCLTFENLNAADMADKIKTLYQNPDLREKMGNNGKKAVLEKYNLQTAGQTLLELYKS